MTESTIKIDQTLMQDVVRTAMLQLMTDEARQTIITEAIEKLTLRPPKTSYNQNPESPLERAWDEGLRAVAAEVVKEMLSEEDIRTATKAAMREQMEKLVEDRGLQLSIGMAIGSTVEEYLRGR